MHQGRRNNKHSQALTRRFSLGTRINNVSPRVWFLPPGIAGGRRYSKSNTRAFSHNRVHDTITPLTHTTYPRPHTRLLSSQVGGHEANFWTYQKDF